VVNYEPLPISDQTIRIGELTVTGEGGAQARDADGDPINITSIDSQPSTRWTLSSGKLVATGTPAMVSEQIVATVDGQSVTINVLVIPNMVTVASEAEFEDINMTPAGVGDFTILVRAGVSITGSIATSKIAGTSITSRRNLGGTLTLTGELVNGLPACNMDGRFLPKFFNAGKFVWLNFDHKPTDPVDQAYANTNTSSLLDICDSPTTEYVIDGIQVIGNPNVLTWPGKTGDGGTNNWGHDPWGALVRVNAVSGVSRPYVDGQIDDGPDILTFTGSGIKRVLMGIKSLGSGNYELQLGDKTHNAHSTPPGSVSAEGTVDEILIGDVVSGLDGFAATVIAPPSGVDTAGGRYAGAAAYTYVIYGTRWLDSSQGRQNGGTARAVKNLTVRNCDVSACHSSMHPYAIEYVTLEQNRFHDFMGDFIKVGNPVGNPNFIWNIRRNDFYSILASSTDLGADHIDYIQIFGAGGYWQANIHHNRILCNARGNGQGFWLGDGPAYQDSQIFGNILILENGGNAITVKFSNNGKAVYNTVLINQKQTPLPDNWAPGNGSSMATTFAPFTPNTNNYVGYNVIKRFNASTIKTEFNYGINGNISMVQDAMFVGLAATKPSRPFFFETYEEMMVGAQTKSPVNPLAGALGTHTDWSDYPYYVVTDDSDLPFTLVYDPGVPSELSISLPTATGGVETYTGSVNVNTAAGDLYYVVYPSTATVPDADQIQAGVDGDNDPATDSGSLAITTAGIKNVSGSVTSDNYKISYVQVVGANTSAVVTSATMAVTAAGITAVTSAFTEYSSTVQNSTMRETVSFTPVAGQPLIICVGSMNNADNTLQSLVVTIGAAGRAEGTGTTLTAASGTHGFSGRATGAIYVIDSDDVVATAQTIQVGFGGGTTRALVISGWQAAGAASNNVLGATGTTGTLTNSTTMSPSITTGTNGSAVIYLGVVANGATTPEVVTTTDATQLSNIQTAATSTAGSDETVVVAWELVPTAGVNTATFTWPISRSRYGCAVEIKA
jgi:hypothetical protein